MSYSPIQLWDENVPGLNTANPRHVPKIKPYLLPGDRAKSSVIVFPGGGYHGKAPHEGEPIALWLNKIGLSAFVLDYRVHPYQHPYPKLDGQRAVRLVRSKANEFNINPDQIGILGFSAGGHLASTIATQFDEGNPNSVDKIEQESSRPNALILCYPVITFYEHRHIGSMETLIGENPPEELRRSLSTEFQVTRDTPQTFLFHTANDSAVPVENSLLFANSLSKNEVPFELHIFPDGPHGVGLAENDPFLKNWTNLCELWFKKIGYLTQ